MASNSNNGKTDYVKVKVILVHLHAKAILCQTLHSDKNIWVPYTVIKADDLGRLRADKITDVIEIQVEPWFVKKAGLVKI